MSSAGGDWQMKMPWTLVSLFVVLAVTGCGTGPSQPNAQGQTRSKTKTQVSAPTQSPAPAPGSSPPIPMRDGAPSLPGGPAPNIPPLSGVIVNGCDALHSVWGGFCVSTLPYMTQGSAGAGAIRGSEISVGQTVDVKGAVEVAASTRTPIYPDVYMDGPGGWKTLIPTAPDGGYDQTVTFTKEGWYQIGVLYDGVPVAGNDFFVPYVPHPAPGTTFSAVFPGAAVPSVLSNSIVLTAPQSAPTTFHILFTDVQGNPARNQTFGSNPTITTDSSGEASVTFIPDTTSTLSPTVIYGNLLVLPYWTLPVSGGQITSWPPVPQGFSNFPTTVATVTKDGIVYYDVGEAVSRLDPLNFPPTISMSPSDGSLDLGTVVLERGGQILAQTCNPNCQANSTAPPEGQVSPVISGGQIYLDLPDLVTLLNTFDFASVAPDGSLRFSDFFLP